VRVRIGFVACVTLLLAACGSSDEPPPHAAREVPWPAPQRALPASEQLASDLVMAPIGRDQRGCVVYKLESQSRPAIQSVFYRTHGGDFSTIEEEAACT
jgi:hypothetical protein